MTVVNIQDMLQSAVNRAEQNLFIAADQEFASRLTVGQIIKGKVLRHYEGNRYSVNFGGQEKVVDSSIPLKTGEIIHGRVIGLNDKVQLQRVFPPGEQAATSQAVVKPNQDAPLPRSAAAVADFFAQHQGKLIEAELNMLGHMAKISARPDLIAMSGLALSKLGIRLDSNLVKALYRALESNTYAAKRTVHNIAPELTTNVVSSQGVSIDAIEQLAASLMSKPISSKANSMVEDQNKDIQKSSVYENQVAESIKPLTEKRESFERNLDQQKRYEWLLGRLLLNVQGDGSVAHKLTSVPIWFGDRLIEVDMALFSQKHNTKQNADIHYRKLVLSLNTAELGYVEITVNVANKNLRIEIDADSEEATRILSNYLPELKETLNFINWQLDEISYKTVKQGDDSKVAHSVVEHYIAQDSLSRLM